MVNHYNRYGKKTWITISEDDKWKYHRTKTSEGEILARVTYDKHGKIDLISYSRLYRKELLQKAGMEMLVDRRFKSSYWNWWWEHLERWFWPLSPLLFIIWLPLVIIKLIFKLLWWIIKMALTLLTFGLINNWLNKE